MLYTSAVDNIKFKFEQAYTPTSKPTSANGKFNYLF